MHPILRVIQACLSCLLLAQAGAAAADVPASPAFDDATFAVSQPRCGPGSLLAIRSPGNQYLSVLRTAKAKTDPEFLAVGTGYPARQSATCVLQVVLQQPLASRRTLSVDFRGVELKGKAASTSQQITIGPQTHIIQYPRGRYLDAGPGTELKRFLVDLPKGTQRVPIRVAGTAVSLDGAETAMIGFEALDLCFVDPDHPDFCGAAGKPNERAKE